MLHVRVGRVQLHRPGVWRFWKFILMALSVAFFCFFLLQKYSEFFGGSTETIAVSERLKMEVKTVNPCPTTICPEDQFSFYLQSGGANVIPPKICFKNELILGVAKKNTGVGINVAVLNGKTGALIQTGYYDMWIGEVNPLIELLKKTETGTIILMASYDEPASKLNEEARKLILELGSSSVKSLGFRDNWIFVGGKGANVKSSFEKILKNNPQENKYKGWPEIIDLSGCIPRYLG